MLLMKSGIAVIAYITTCATTKTRMLSITKGKPTAARTTLRTTAMDAIYIISMNNGDSSGISRLEKSIFSLRSGTRPFRLCIADSSRLSLLEQIKSLNIGDYEYVHCPKPDPYNRSYNINAGFKAFAKSDYFWLSDIDILYDPRHLETCETLSAEYDYVLFSMKKIEYDGSVNIVEAGGGFLCKTSLFDKLRGFDERYVGWGAEDNDFTERVIHDGARVKRCIKDPILTHMWHFTNKTDKELVKANEYRLIALRDMILKNKFDPKTVNPDGWRGVIHAC